MEQESPFKKLVYLLPIYWYNFHWKRSGLSSTPHLMGPKDKSCPLQRVIAMEINIKISGEFLSLLGGLCSLVAAIITAL
jgi:hypothetical protein